MTRMILRLTFLTLLWSSTTAFTTPAARTLPSHGSYVVPKMVNSKGVSPSSFRRSNRSMVNNSGDDQEFSRQVRLREEVESPFRKVRYFFYITTAGGAFTSLAISIARIAAATLSGVNEDLLPESLLNAGVDIAGLALVAFLYQRDRVAEESRLRRATKGAELAKLTVRASKRIIDGDISDDGSTFTTSLASLRRGRGIEKRVVIAAAGKDKIDQVLKDAKDFELDMEINDLLIVPVVMPNGVAPIWTESDTSGSNSSSPPASVALPVVVGNNWKSMIDDEASEATSQGVDILNEGFCVVLKKNGKVGQRTRGINLQTLLGNVVARREAGMDVTNI